MFGSRRTCHTVCVRAVVSTPTAISTRSGSSREVTSRCQTSRYARCGPPLGSGSGVGQYGCLSYGVSAVPVRSRSSGSKPLRRVAVVLREQPVDVHPAAADRQLAAGRRDAEPVGRLARHPRLARLVGVGAERREVDRLRAQPPVEQRDVLVEVGVEEQPSLLEHDAREVAERVEPHAADVGTHL